MTQNLRPGGNAGQSFPAEVLTPAEVRALMDACRAGALGDRNRALIALMYRAGLRVSEALALRPVDVDARALRRAELRAKRLRLWLQTFQADACAFPILPDSYDLIVAAALLHFLPPDCLPDLAAHIAAGLRPGGYVYASVLTTDDPGSAILRRSGAPELAPNTFVTVDLGISPTLHYFGKGELRALFPSLDIVYYAEERYLRPGSDQGYNAAAVLLARKA